MKKKIAMIMAGLMAASMMLSACGSSSATSSAAPAPAASTGSTAAASGAESEEAAASTWAPSRNVDWYCASSPGGGSDIFSRMITDIMTTEGITDQTLLVTNKTDGGGEVVKAQVSETKAGDQADHTLMTYNVGELLPMLLNTDRRIEDFTPIAVMALDKQLLFSGPQSPYKDFQSVIDAIAAGTPVTLSGSKGDDEATYAALLEEMGWTEEQLVYVRHDASSDAITTALGGHSDLVISKPAASAAYVAEGVEDSKRLTPILAMANERYTTGALAEAPTLSEVDPNHNNVEVPTWRGVCGPRDMSPEAAQFWSDALRQVSETEQWKTDYLDKNMLVGYYLNLEETKEYMTQAQVDYLASIGKAE